MLLMWHYCEDAIGMHEHLRCFYLIVANVNREGAPDFVSLNWLVSFSPFQDNVVRWMNGCWLSLK